MSKMSHEQAHYHAASSKTRRCGTCSMYRHGKTPSCSLVESPIKSGDVCRYYRATKGEKHVA
jgi:hypothetical protein